MIKRSVFRFFFAFAIIVCVWDDTGRRWWWKRMVNGGL